MFENLTPIKQRQQRFLDNKLETMQSYVDFAMGRGMPKSPLEVFLEVSNVCNMKCAMCAHFSALNPERLVTLREQERGFFDVEKSASSLEQLMEGTLLVHCYGFGEPTIHPQFRDMLRHVGHYEVMTDFFTNGMHLTPELIEEIIMAPVYRITVSFSGSTAEDYENVYLDGKFDTVLNNLNLLLHAKQQAKSKYPIIEINSIGFKHHIEKLDQFVEMMSFYGVQTIHVKNLVEYPRTIDALKGHDVIIRDWVEGDVVRRALALAHSYGMNLSLETMDFAATEEEYQALRQARSKLNRYGQSVEEDTINVPITEFKALAEKTQFKTDPHRANIPQDAGPTQESAKVNDTLNFRSLDSVNPNSEFYCMEPFKTVYVRKEGYVKPCCFATNQTSLGQVHESSGLDIWQGPAYEAIRSNIMERQYPMKLYNHCLQRNLAPRHHWGQNLMREYIDWYQNAYHVEDSDAFALVTKEFDALGTNIDIVRRQQIKQSNATAQTS